MRHLVTLLLIVCCRNAHAASEPWKEIFDTNRRSVVFIEAYNGDQLVDTGSGVIVSKDGYILSVAHIGHPAPELPPVTKLWARIGERNGPKYELEELDWDKNSDISLLRLPSSECQRAARLNFTRPRQSDPVVVVGFGGDQALGPYRGYIGNLHARRDYYNTDAAVTNGSSGAPVFDLSGAVIAIVQGGVGSGRRDVDLVPISRAIPMLLEYSVPIAGEPNCTPDAPVELFNATTYARVLKAGSSETFDADLPYQQGDITLCISVSSPQAPQTQQIFATFRRADAATGDHAIGIPFFLTDRDCKSQSGIGALYVAQALKEGRYIITLTIAKPPISNMFGSSPETSALVSVGYGLR